LVKKRKSLHSNATKQSNCSRHIPQRSCIACRNVRDKRDLVRLVYTGESVEIDPGKKLNGRGAYLCPVYECWDTGLSKNRLEYALRTKISEENRRMLVEYSKSLPKKDMGT
jgi:predicted RNA-binding protein YlxR (DUF448 family)